MEMDTRSDLSSPLPHNHPIFPPLSLPASGPADVTVLFPYSSPPPALSSRVKHHYIITQGWIIVMVVCVRLEKGSEVVGVPTPDKERRDDVKWIFCYDKGWKAQKITRIFFPPLTLLRFLCDKLTFILVSGVRVLVSAWCGVCVACVLLWSTPCCLI